MPLKILIVLLRLGGTLLVTAFFAMIMPTDWMAATHEWLGLGEFPRLPLVDYLTRSVAAIYGFHGVLLFVLSTDPVKYLRVVRVLAWMNIVFGVSLLFIDLHAGLPMWWTLMEGPPVAVLGIVMVRLCRLL